VGGHIKGRQKPLLRQEAKGEKRKQNEPCPDFSACKIALGVGCLGAVLVVSVFLVVSRYLQYRWHAEDANLYGGMWAGGDMVLGVFIFRSKQLDGRLGLIHDLSRPICEPER